MPLNIRLSDLKTMVDELTLEKTAPSEEYFMVMEIMEKMAQKVYFTKTWSELICTVHCFQKIHISVTI